ncbi:uncharacterized protein LOC116190475 [Punica granatum]|uniref:Uncharacterized protein LOC116190475 n=1 Tax=Punica granatum TaxID=22663 RepID=A0A6P8C0G8_PUNGR|nr:uncharacterized protein LOC116190475 [Punica granatum]
MEEIDPPVPSGEVTPPTTVRSQLPATHAPPYAPPSMYMPSTPVPPVLPSSNEAIRIAVLEGTVNQMTSNIIELMALLSGPNRASSSSIPPPAYGSMVDPSPWVPPTLAPENDVVPIPAPTHFPATVPPLTHAPEVCPSVAPLPVTLSVTFPPPPMTISIIDPAMLALPPMLVSATSTHAPAPIAEPFPFPAPQPQISLPHRTPSILNIPYHNPDTQAVAAPEAPPTYIIPTAEIEQERRMKRMEEMMKALQESDSRYDTSYLDLNLFPNMRLPPKIKIPDFDKYDGTTDPKPHLQGYRNRMMPYWGYEQFMIQTFQESLKGAALSWFTSLKAADIPTWDELTKKFVTQYGYNTGIAPSYLELSVMEMQEEQAFVDYATQWRVEAAKHRPPIDEAKQIQIFHGTLKGEYYSHLLGHMSSFNAMIKAGKKVSLGIKLGRIDHSVRKGEGESSKKTAVTAASSHNRKGKDANVSVVNPGHPSHQQYAVNVAPSFPLPYHPAPQQQYPAQPIYYSAPPAYAPLQAPQSFGQQYTSAFQVQSSSPPASRIPHPAQGAPTPLTQQGNRGQVRPRPQYLPLPVPQSNIFRQLLAAGKINPEAPNENFNPANLNQNLCCEYHMGPPGHTTDNCYTLRGKLQALIDKKLLSFNEVKPPNVQINPLPDHGSSSARLST